MQSHDQEALALLALLARRRRKLIELAAGLSLIGLASCFQVAWLGAGMLSAAVALGFGAVTMRLPCDELEAALVKISTLEHGRRVNHDRGQAT